MTVKDDSEPDGAEDARRIPPLEGGRNFRDLGGYATHDGRRVRWHRLYRSGSPAELTARDWGWLLAQGVRAVCDLRGTQERDAAPFAWRQSPGIGYWTRDYETSFGELRALMMSDFTTGEAAREAMMAGYRRLPFEQAPGYREIFRRLKAGEVPLMFNCSAGKDRAGTAAALILSALGVPRDVVREDYLLSNRHLGFSRAATGKAGGGSLFGRLSPDVRDAILTCEPYYLDAAFAAIDETCGSFPAYCRDILETDEADIAIIRHSLLE
jgi:protein-tyrosine phosphatase